jgi:hypothetical protein
MHLLAQSIQTENGPKVCNRLPINCETFFSFLPVLRIFSVHGIGR